ncbi:MAG TPA: hypothetical protein VKS98_03060 [Chthoniobacterales bacterium]|nr:hypothetical protein [Chthoniobacterales bacterium]
MSSQPGVSKNVGRLMIAIVVGFALVALYANIQKWRRPAIENVVFTPGGIPSAKPTPSPAMTPTQ